MQKITVQEKIDRIFKEIGEFGPYQLLIILICGSTSIVPGMIAYSDEFIKSDPDHRYKPFFCVSHQINNSRLRLFFKRIKKVCIARMG